MILFQYNICRISAGLFKSPCMLTKHVNNGSPCMRTKHVNNGSPCMRTKHVNNGSPCMRTKHVNNGSPCMLTKQWIYILYYNSNTKCVRFTPKIPRTPP